jgi:hypothetical protein
VPRPDPGTGQSCSPGVINEDQTRRPQDTQAWQELYRSHLSPCSAISWKEKGWPNMTSLFVAHGSFLAHLS